MKSLFNSDRFYKDPEGPLRMVHTLYTMALSCGCSVEQMSWLACFSNERLGKKQPNER
jgi:hypothetical protein